MRKKKRTTIIAILLIILLLLAVGYAAFSSNLKIGGTATADGSWDIHFENVVLEKGGDNTAILSEDKKTLTVDVKLTYPGDKETITVDVVNKGTIDAYLTEFNIEAKDGSNNVIPANGGTYTSGVIKMTLESLTTGEELVAKEGVKPYRMVFEWMEDSIIDGNTNDSLTFNITFTYSQNQSEGGGNIGDNTGDNNDDGVTTKPYLPSTDFHYVAETSLEDGLVIEDNIGNQYVWIEVPRTIDVYPTATLDIKDFTDEEYTKIENDLHTYTATYSATGMEGSCIDDWSGYSGGATNLGFASDEEYNELKKTMLKSVYQNGGFYIGRYEAAAENGLPASKANLSPWTSISCIDAQKLASKVESGSCTSSLMFGVQWNLVMKYLETKGVTESELKTNSTGWGNYRRYSKNRVK